MAYICTFFIPYAFCAYLCEKGARNSYFLFIPLDQILFICILISLGNTSSSKFQYGSLDCQLSQFD